jgi:cytochrome P450
MPYSVGTGPERDHFGGPMSIDAATLAEPTAARTPSGESRPVPAAPRPHPRRLGLFAAIRAINENAITVFDESAYREPVVEYPELGGLLLVNDPEVIEDILVVNKADYIHSNQHRRLLTPALGDGLLTAEGETWQTTRRIAAPLFSPRALAQLFDDMPRCAEAMIERWRDRPDPEEALDLCAEFHRLTYEIISRAAFSGALEEDRTRVHANMALYFDTICRVDLATLLNLPVWVPTPNAIRARPALSVIRSVVDRVVGERIKDRDRAAADLLDRLMRTPDPKTGATLSLQAVGDNVRTFLAAGHNTTGNALTWIFYLLALHPEDEARLLEELTEVLGEGPLTAESLERLVFARAVVNEALRLYPPVPLIGRQPLKPVALCGRRIKPGKAIVISPWVVHRHRSLWEAPEYFVPDRFLPPADGGIRRGTFIPFGLGSRICIGMGFAMQEILAVLAAILPHFRYRLVDAGTVFPEARASLRPAGGLPVLLTPRR